MKYEITKEQLQELAKGNAKVERWFPELFQPKYEIGKWYKVDGNKCGQEGRQLLANYSGENSNSNYGFNFLGIWDTELTLNNKDLGVCTFEAAESEVFEALKKEAVKRGYKKGAKIRCLLTQIEGILEEDDILYEANYAGKNGLESAFLNTYINSVLFKDGFWAEIIKEKTLSKSEAESRLNELINDGYAYKID